MNEFFTLMKSELVITAIIFILLFIKLSSGVKSEMLLLIIQSLLLLNLVAGFFFNAEGTLFDGMYHT
ncbi:MAG: NADH-quinone oxidoreductase subunit N, partial [Ginsengibacter sp.]